jgi:hypothetical protein
MWRTQHSYQALNRQQDFGKCQFPCFHWHIRTWDGVGGWGMVLRVGDLSLSLPFLWRYPSGWSTVWRAVICSSCTSPARTPKWWGENNRASLRFFDSSLVIDLSATGFLWNKKKKERYHFTFPIGGKVWKLSSLLWFGRLIYWPILSWSEKHRDNT